ncbi:hypothetical protein VUR80DRAFT_8254 [Thermomyces stellatus]
MRYDADREYVAGCVADRLPCATPGWRRKSATEEASRCLQQGLGRRALSARVLWDATLVQERRIAMWPDGGGLRASECCENEDDKLQDLLGTDSLPGPMSASGRIDGRCFDVRNSVLRGALRVLGVRASGRAVDAAGPFCFELGASWAGARSANRGVV